MEAIALSKLRPLIFRIRQTKKLRGVLYLVWCSKLSEQEIDVWQKQAHSRRSSFAPATWVTTS